MRHEKDIRHATVWARGEWCIIRSEAKPCDPITEQVHGHTRVYYDVCDADNMIASYKTLREAKKFIKEMIE